MNKSTLGFVFWYSVTTVFFLKMFGSIPDAFDMAAKFVGFADGVWIPAVLTVFGSFLLYSKREEDRRERLKSAFIAELRELSTLSKLPVRLHDLDKTPTKERIPPDAIPPAEALPTLVYENNTESLSRLDQDTVEEIVRFYSMLIRHKATIRMIHEEDPKDNSTQTLPMSDHKDLLDEAGDLRRNRRQLLNRLEN